MGTIARELGAFISAGTPRVCDGTDATRQGSAEVQGFDHHTGDTECQDVGGTCTIAFGHREKEKPQGAPCNEAQLNSGMFFGATLGWRKHGACKEVPFSPAEEKRVLPFLFQKCGLLQLRFV